MLMTAGSRPGSAGCRSVVGGGGESIYSGDVMSSRCDVTARCGTVSPHTRRGAACVVRGVVRSGQR